MRTAISRRNFMQSGALATACAFSGAALAAAEALPEKGKPSPIKLGLASYTFRNFSRAQMIGYMKQLDVSALNAKDVKDHLPTDPTQESQAIADYTAADIKLHAAGAIYFLKEEDNDTRAKLDYCKRAGVTVIVAGDPPPASLPRVERFVKEYDIRIAIHNHGPEDKLWRSPLDILTLVKNIAQRTGSLIAVAH